MVSAPRVEAFRMRFETVEKGAPTMVNTANRSGVAYTIAKAEYIQLSWEAPEEQGLSGYGIKYVIHTAGPRCGGVELRNENEFLGMGSRPVFISVSGRDNGESRDHRVRKVIKRRWER